MSSTPFRIPASDQERNTVIQKLSLNNEVADFIEADVALALASQEICRSRDDLEDFALRKGLTPYLKIFLHRRGWLDADWHKRLSAVRDVFQHLVN